MVLQCNIILLIVATIGATLLIQSKTKSSYNGSGELWSLGVRRKGRWLRRR